MAKNFLPLIKASIYTEHSSHVESGWKEKGKKWGKSKKKNTDTLQFKKKKAKILKKIPNTGCIQQLIDILGVTTETQRQRNHIKSDKEHSTLKNNNKLQMYTLNK